MSKVTIQYVRPGPEGLREAIARLTKRGGLVSAVSDAKLRVLKEEIGDTPNIEVVPVGQLVGRFLNAQGEPYGRLASKGQVRAMVALACERLPEDSPFSRVARYPGFHRAVQRLLDQLAHADWEAVDLDLAVETLDPWMTETVRTVAEIRRAVDTMKDELRLEDLQSWVRRSLALESLRPHPLGPIVLFAGPDPHPLLGSWAEWAAKTGAGVTWVEEGFGFEGHPQPQDWTSALFTERLSESERPAVTLSVAADPLAECEWALREAARASAGGAFEHRIVIVARDPESTAPLLFSSAKRLGVPIDIALPVPLLTNGLAAWTASVLIALGGRDVRKLLHCVRNSYAGLDESGRVEAERSIREAYREGEAAWPTLAAWADSNVDTQPWLRHALHWRQQVAGTFQGLGGWHARLRDLVVGPVTPISVFDSQGVPSPTLARDLRAQTAMFRAIADHAATHDRFGGTALDLHRFAALAKQLWEGEEMVQPSEGFGIRFASQAASVVPSDHVIVLGLLEGTFPRRPIEDPVFPDDIRVALAAASPGKAPLRLASDIPAAERREFIRLCASAKESLTLSHPQSGEESDHVPAFFLEELARAVGNQVHQVVYRRDQLAPDEPTLPADFDLAHALTSPKQFPDRAELVSLEGRLLAKPPFETGVRPEEIAVGRLCPFRSVFRYRFELFQSRRRDPWASLRRLPRQARLATAPNPEVARSQLGVALDGALDVLLGDYEPWELEVFRGVAEGWIAGWVAREFQARDLWHGIESERQGPIAMSEEPLRNKLRLDDKSTVTLDGRFDALSQVGPYAILHLFREGVIDFKNEQAFVEFGLKLISAMKAAEGLALEVDNGNQRRLFLLPRFGEPRMMGRMQQNLIVSEVHTDAPSDSQSRGTFARAVVARATEGIEEIKLGAGVPKPGEHCRDCPYGELCRSSSVFGESQSPFGSSERPEVE
ncbi:MAG TPA: hypothetical protein PLH94_09485 [Fimbriimonadaceae bacterium]|nr:hypothetical protein [Fimbriimonadaceae bacterium]